MPGFTTGSPIWYDIRPDALGNVVALSHISGNRVESYAYTPFGTPTVYDAAGDPIAASAVGNPYGFTGRRYDPESGLYYYRHRMVSPQLGRFMQTDPIGCGACPEIGRRNSMNLYQYCGNNPVNWIDPWGLSVMGWVHGTLDTVGIAGDAFGPIGSLVGAGADLINASIYAFEGEWGEAGISALSAAPVVGNFAKGGSKGLKAAKGVAKLAEAADTVGDTAKACDKVGDAAKAARAADKIRDGAKLPVDEALDAAEDFLGPGYREVSPGRYVSGDGLRQVRMGDSDILGKHGSGPHLNFKTFKPNPRKPGKMIPDTNKHIYIVE